MNAHPGPMVSGSHFFPNAPLLWVKWMPACAVMSRKCTWAHTGETHEENIHHRGTDTRRRKEGILARCLRDSVVDLIFGRIIYLEAPADAVATWLAALRRTAEAAVPTWSLARAGSGTDTCSCTACRSLLSSGCAWRYGPVIAWDDSSALNRIYRA